MDLAAGNKNVVVGLVVIMVYLSMTFFIERTAALHQFQVRLCGGIQGHEILQGVNP